MPVDKFGRVVHRSSSSSGGKQQQRPLFPLTSTGGFDIEQRRLSNIGHPLEENDAVPLKRLTEEVKTWERREKFYTDKIDPLLVQINNGINQLQPIIEAKKQGQLLTQQESIDLMKTERQRFETFYVSLVNPLAENFNKTIAKLTERVDVLERYHKKQKT